MSNFFKLYKSSLGELKKPKTVVTCGLLLAIALTLGTQSIKLGEIAVISLSFIPVSITGFLFGPIPAALLGASNDVIGHFMKPMGTYFFGYTFNAILSGLFYGTLLYRKQWGMNKFVLRVVIARILVSIIVNLTFGTLWTSMFFGKSFMVLFPARLTKEVIVAPIQGFLTYTLLKVINRYSYVLNIDDN